MARDYEVVSLETVLSGELPRRALLITFDDGYRSIAEVALPILRRLGLPSVFFVTGECLERDYSRSTTSSRTYARASASIAWERRSTPTRAASARSSSSSTWSPPCRTAGAWGWGMS
jgi:peptidoglycan/xylan/chitin deacetylase (PgdA/CDA1 family)